MSERESKFIQYVSGIVASLIIAILIGSFAFYRVTIVNQALQEEKNRNTEIRIQIQDEKIETMRKEWREDQKEMKENISSIAVRIDALN